MAPKLSRDECYCCSNRSTSREHIPPLCFFPENKDLPHGLNLRQRLITVPACDEHNLRKSKDDEYLLYSVVLCITSNPTGLNHFLTKILRSINHDPTLINRMLSKSNALNIQDDESNTVIETATIQLENARIHTSLELLGRGLYYHQFKRKWLGKIRIYPEFLISLDQVSSDQTNANTIKLREAADTIFEDLPRLGHNPTVFQYQFAPGEGPYHLLSRLYFYGKTKVLLMYDHDA